MKVPSEKIVTSIIDYIKTRTIFRLFMDLIFLVGLTFSIGMIYLAINNFSDLKDIFISTEQYEQQELKKNVILNNYINTELVKLLENIDANRSYVTKFHNGKTSIDGLHFFFGSRTNEQVSSGISKVFHEEQNVSLSLFNPWIERYLLKECVFYKELKSDDDFFYFLDKQGIKSTIRCPIYNSDDLLIGYVGVDFVTRTIKDLDENTLFRYVSSIKSTADRISGILTQVK